MQLDPTVECVRLDALKGFGVLDTPPEPAFDELAALAAKICDVPIAVVSLVDSARQWFKAKVGLDVSETPREVAFCSHALLSKDLLIVPDATLDERFCHNPLVTGPLNLRFYAGAPLWVSEGIVMGTLCVIDRRPRELTSLQCESLRVLARQVVTQLELRRQARELAAVSQAYQRMVDYSLDVICTINAEGIFIHIGGACSQLWGYQPRELMGRSHEEFVHPMDLARSQETTMRIRSGQPTRDFENRVLHKNGMNVHMMWSAVWSDRDQVFYAVGRDVGALKVAQEEIRSLNQDLERRIHERTVALDAANQELRFSAERYEAAVRGTHDGIWDWNLITQEDYFSDRWCELLGYTSAELHPHVDTWIRHLHPDDRENATQAAQDHLERRTPYDLEYRLRTKSGAYRWFRARGQAVWDECGKPIRMAGSITDITERRGVEEERLRYQEQLRAMSAKLLQSEEAERHRIANDIHDQIGQTLAACRMQMGECIAGMSDPQMTAQARGIRGLLEQAIRETRSLTFDLSPPVLHELGLGAALHWLAEKHHTPGRLDVRCDAVDHVSLPSDLSVLMFRISQELISNVIKHSKAKRVEIRLSCPDSWVRIEVADDGIGFDPNAIPVGDAQLGGFGLFSARDRLRYVGGRLELDSRPGQGTHAVILVPNPATHPAARSGPVNEVEPNVGTRRF